VPAFGHAYPGVQSLHVTAPVCMRLPAGHWPASGFGDVEPGGHTKPTLQLRHADQPLSLYLPAGQMATVALVAPGAGQ
jgi:hypothetical protein